MSRTPSSLRRMVFAGGEGVRLKEFVRERVGTDGHKGSVFPSPGVNFSVAAGDTQTMQTCERSKTS